MTGWAIVAGVGCRRGCGAAAIVAIVRRAEGEVGRLVTALAAPEFKRGEAGLRDAAGIVGVPLLFVTNADLSAAQPGCVTRSGFVRRATGHASVAEAAALAAGGGRLLLARIDNGSATCAVAGG